MRMTYLLAGMFAAGFFSTQALADAQTYCETYGKDFANGKTSDVEAWESNFRNAFGDCMTQYAAGQQVAETPKKVVVVPARDSSRKKRIPILTPGSIAWNNYCASKYASFNPATGNYTSHGGKSRPCLVPSN